LVLCAVGNCLECNSGGVVSEWKSELEDRESRSAISWLAAARLRRTVQKKELPPAGAAAKAPPYSQ
jgi:hypothetical protein